MVQVHYLDLHEKVQLPPEDETEDKFERFHMSWYLQVEDGIAPKSFCKSSNNDNEFTIKEGDLIAIDECFTGAGDCEGIRVVGPLQKKEEENEAGDKDKTNGSFRCYLLLGLGIEYPEFPQETLDWVKKNNNGTLKDLYEGPINEILDAVAGCPLEDLVDDVDEFWDSCTNQDGPYHKPDVPKDWFIPLSECTWKPCLRPEETQGEAKRSKVEDEEKDKDITTTKEDNQQDKNEEGKETENEK